MRVALAQIDPTVGDIDGNAAKIAEWIGACRSRGRRAGDLPRALHPRLPGRGPLPEAALRRGQPARGRGAGPRRPRDRRPWSASPSRSPAAATSATPTTRSPCSPTVPCRPSTARTGCPTTPSSTSSATSSRASEPATIEVAGDAGRPDGLRGRLGAGPAGVERGGGRREPDRQSLGLAVSPRQGPRARSDVRRARPRLRRRLRLLQPRRRPGRAGLRRPQPRRRRRGQR